MRESCLIKVCGLWLRCNSTHDKVSLGTIGKPVLRQNLEKKLTLFERGLRD
jgi:hypothetical protein